MAIRARLIIKRSRADQFSFECALGRRRKRLAWLYRNIHASKTRGDSRDEVGRRAADDDSRNTSLDLETVRVLERERRRSTDLRARERRTELRVVHRDVPRARRPHLHLR